MIFGSYRNEFCTKLFTWTGYNYFICTTSCFCTAPIVLRDKSAPAQRWRHLPRSPTFARFLCVIDLLQPVALTGSPKAVPCVNYHHTHHHAYAECLPLHLGTFQYLVLGRGCRISGFRPCKFTYPPPPGLCTNLGTPPLWNLRKSGHPPPFLVSWNTVCFSRYVFQNVGLQNRNNSYFTLLVCLISWF